METNFSTLEKTFSIGFSEVCKITNCSIQLFINKHGKQLNLKHKLRFWNVSGNKLYTTKGHQEEKWMTKLFFSFIISETYRYKKLALPAHNRSNLKLLIFLNFALAIGKQYMHIDFIGIVKKLHLFGRHLCSESPTRN